MPKRRNPKKKLSGNTPSIVNLFLDVLIFVLVILVIYLAYSLFLKFNSPSKILPTGIKKEVPSDIIQAEVLNGCGIAGLAERFTDYLRENKVDVVNMHNYKMFDVPETIVIDRSGNFANAKKIAEILGVKRKNVLQEIDKNLLLDVTVIIGQDYFKLKPIK